MGLNHLTDAELIDYTIKHDDDPVRVRLAMVMENMPGAILDDLEKVGMDPAFCTFNDDYAYGDRHVGDYIRHLRNEIDFLNNELAEANEKLAALEKRTVLDFMVEIGQTVQTLEVRLQNAEADAHEAKSKLSMWAKLNGDFSGKYKD